MSDSSKVEIKKPPQRSGGSMGSGGSYAAIEKPKNFKGTISKLLNLLKPYYFKIILVIIFSAASVLFATVGPIKLGEGINLISDGVAQKVATGTGGIDFDAIRKVVYTLIALYLSSIIFMVLQNFIITKVAQEVSYDLRKDITKKINHLPLKYFDKQSTGDVMSRVTNDIDTISQSLNQSLSQIITSVTTVVGVLFMMLSISPIMTIIAILVVPISMFLVIIIVRLSQKYFRQQQEYLGKVNGQVEEVFSGHIVVKAFSNEKNAVKEFKANNENLYTTGWKSQFLSGIMMPAMSFIGNLGYVAVCILGGYLGINGKIKIGGITAFISYIRSFNQPITQIAQISNILQSTVAASERVFEFLEEEDEMAETKNAIDIKNIKGNVQFENVCFGYNQDKIIINDFTANIKRGRKVAIVGPTGAGKTTIVKLLMRFYELNSGKIKIDGHDINDFTRRDLRSLFSMVLQDTWLFNGTIMENIRYGNLNATDQEVFAATKAVNVHRLIKTLPSGYDMVLNEEVNNISQGQKQLLTIARAILSNPEILILDEATSSVDTRTELLIQQGMAKLMEGRTSFIIAHRLSTIKDADLILVMDKGDIVEQGNHNELIAQGGFYYNLYNSQFEQGA